ncbi:hypothetical protein [Bacillus subtilis]|nr:hypothetical protein [Bacillus subtilis]
MEIEEKKRAKNQEQAIKNYQNLLASGLSEINQIKQSLANTQASQQTTYIFSLQFLDGEWSVSSGDGFVSLAASILSLNTDDDYTIQYVTGDANFIMKEAGYSLYVDDVDVNKINITLYKDGKLSDPLEVPDGSKVKILIVGQK